MNDHPSIYERYSRQMLFKPIGSQGQANLAESRVLIVGLGALGSVLANHMVRAGVGFVHIVDRDYVEYSNLQRQMLYDEEDAKQAYPKAIAAEKKLRNINSNVRIEAIVTDVTPLNVESLLEGINLVLDGTDNFQTRLLLNDACFKAEIPFVYGGAVSSQGMAAMFIPSLTCCLRCLIGAGEGGAGTCDTIGVISPIVDIVASLQAVEALKYLVHDEEHRNKSLLTIDVWHNQWLDMLLPGPRQDCPTCGTNQYPSLQPSADDTTALCGRETIQIYRSQSFNLSVWADRLSASCQLFANPFLLKAQLPEGETIVLFPDGRALVQGTEDLVRARTLFDKYIGT